MYHKKIICGLCACNCILKANFNENGELQRLEGDRGSITGGFACIKGLSLAKISENKNRLRSPLLKQTDGSFVPISLEEALDRLALQMSSIKSTWGASAFAFHSGQAGVRRQFSRLMAYLANLYGSVNYSGIGTTCNMSKRLAYSLTLGALPKCDYRNAKSIVLWGHNAPNTHPYDWRVIEQSCQRGAHLIVINPQKTRASRTSALHLALRPGTDIYLAWAMLKIASNHQWYDQRRLLETTVGLSELQQALAPVDAEAFCRICGLNYAEVELATRILMQETPVTIMVGTAIELQQHGFQTSRAIAILQVLSGIEGLKFPHQPVYQSWPIKPLAQGKMVGADVYPLFTELVGYAQSNVLAKSIQAGEVKGLMVVGGNPLLTWPDAAVNQRSFAQLDFLAVVDNYLTATAKAADLIIPAASPSEKYELFECIASDSEVYINLSEPILPAQGPNEIELFKGLAERLGFGQAMPWQNSLDYFNYLLDPLRLDCERLLQHPNGYHYATGRHWAGLPNRPAKIALTVPALTAFGHEALPLPPVYREPAVDQVILTTCDKPLELVHTRYRTVDPLGLRQQPSIKLNPVLAQTYGIAPGDQVEISRAGFNVQAAAVVTEDLPVGIAAMMHGWDRCNVNLLIRLEELDSVTGFPNAARLEVTLKNLGDDQRG